MTVFIDPVIGAAIVHLGLPILPGLPCPTCRGTGWRCRNSNLMCTHRVHQGCEDCTGSGVWTPPDSPVPIGVTSAEPVRVGRLGPQGPYVNWRDRRRNQGWGWVLDTKGGARYPIVLSSVIGEATLRKVKVVEADADGHGAVVEMRPDGSLWFWPEGAFGEDAATDISSALPFLPGLKPGDTVYLLDGFTESVECAACHGQAGKLIAWGNTAATTLPCPGGACTTGRLSCPFPVNAPDHPCAQP